MLLIPAITLKDGKCAGAHTASHKAEEVVAAWAQNGARRLHVTDMDAGIAGKNAGVEVIRALAAAYPDLPIQVAGNLRNADDVERYVSAGAEYVILDSKAAGAAHFINDLCFEYPGHILMTLEAKSGKPAAGGWSKLAKHPAGETAQRFQQEGVAGIFYRATTDANGVCDMAPAIALAELLTVPVLVSAGLKSAGAARAFCRDAKGLAGAVLDPDYAGTPQDFAGALALAVTE